MRLAAGARPASLADKVFPSFSRPYAAAQGVDVEPLVVGPTPLPGEVVSNLS